jgi:hypothetical protein
MHEDEKRFLKVLKSFIEMFKIDGPFVKKKGEASEKEQFDLNKRVISMMDDFSPDEKAAILHGVLVYLLMLVNDYDIRYNNDTMPTACIIAETMFVGMDSALISKALIDSSSAVIYALENPLTLRKDIQQEDPKMFEILMTANCANGEKGD